MLKLCWRLASCSHVLNPFSFYMNIACIIVLSSYVLHRASNGDENLTGNHTTTSKYNIQTESSTMAIMVLLYAAAVCVLSAKSALFLLWQRSVYSLSVKLWRKKDHSYLSDGWASEFISAMSKISMKRCPLSVYTNMFDAPGYCCHYSAE